MSILFKDIYKPVKDFFTKNHNGETCKVEAKSKTLNGTVFNVIGQSAGPASDLTGEMSFEFPVEVYKSFKLRTLAKSNGSLENKITSTSLASGLKIEGVSTVSTTAGGKGADVCTGMFEYTTQQWSLSGNSLIKDYSVPVAVDFSAVGNYDDFAFGGSAALNKSFSALDKYALGFRYAAKDSTVCGLLENGTNAKLGYVHVLNERTVVGGEYDLKISAPTTDRVTLSVGTEHRVNSDLTVKGRITTKGTLATSFAHTLAPNLKAVLSTEADLSKAAPLKWGIVVTHDTA